MSGIERLLIVDPGHSLASTNRSPDGSYYEWEFNQYVADLVKELSAFIPGLKVRKTKEADTYPTSLAMRTDLANRLGADLFLSIHSNAAGNGGWYNATGWNVYRYYGRNLRLAEIAAEICKETLPLGNWGAAIKERNFHVIRETDMPSLLIEFAFHTNRVDVEYLKTHEYRLLCAKVILKTACKWLGIEYREAEDVKRAKFHIVVGGDNMSRIAGANGITLSEMVSFNPHIPEPKLILAEYGGDILFLEEPSDFEVEYARLRRELILCRKEPDPALLERALAVAQKEIEKVTGERDIAISRSMTLSLKGKQISILASEMMEL